MNELARSFEAEKVGDGRFGFPNPIPAGRGVIYGGHLVGVMMAAALAHESEQTVKSAHGVLATVVVPEKPFEVNVDVLRRGRVLSTATAALIQDGKECARTLLMLTAQEPDLIRHQDAMPEVPGPDEATPWPDALGREVRIVGGVDRGDPDVIAPPELFVWLRFPDAPGDVRTAQPLLAHGTANFLIGTAMLPHAGIGERNSHAEFSSGVLGHTISFHDVNVDASQWMLVTNRSTYTGAGRAFGVGQVFTQDGRLVASFSQESLMRPFPQSHSAHGREATVL